MSIGVSLCLSELASAYPTTAGVHHWVYQLGSARRRAYLSWMVGWFTIVSAVSVTASLAFYFSSILSQILLVVYKIALTPATLVMFHIGVLFVWQILNLLPARGIGYLSTLSVALIGTILSLAKFDMSMGHVPFTAFLNYSGSSSVAYTALSSTLMASFVFCPQDTVVRMAEESRHPERTISRLVVGSTVSNLLFGLLLIIALNYGIAKPIKGLMDESVPSARVILGTMGHSTVVPLWMRLTHEGTLHYTPGKFILGRFSRPLHAISIAWLLLLSLFLMLPSTLPLSKNNFNYTPIAIIVLAFLFSVSWFKARTDFTGEAKGASRASHRISSRSAKDFSQNKQQSNFECDALQSISSLQRPLPQTGRHEHKHPSFEKSKTSSRQGHNFGTSAQTTTVSRYYPQQPLQQQERSPSKPRSDHVAVAIGNQHLEAEVSPAESPEAGTSRLCQQQRYGQTSNLTMTSIASYQSHPSSILGIPFSESPEMLPREFPVMKLDPSSSPCSPAATTVIVSVSVAVPTPKSSVASDSWPTRPIAAKFNPCVVPEMSITPPLTDSVKMSSSSSASKAEVQLPPTITFNYDTSNSITSSSETPLTTRLPLDAVDSIFKRDLSLGQSGKIREILGQNDTLDRIRHSKNRAPTPYPASLVDVGDDTLSDHTSSTSIDGPRSFLLTSPSSLRTLPNDGDMRKGLAAVNRDDSIEGLLRDLGITFAPQKQAASQLLVLAEVNGSNAGDEGAIRKEGESRTGNHGYDASDGLHLSGMLPLSRTPTMQRSDHEYGASFKLDDSDEEQDESDESNDNDVHGIIITEADDSYSEEYSHQYSVISRPKYRVQVISSSNALFGYQRNRPTTNIPYANKRTRDPTPLPRSRHKGGRCDSMERILGTHRQHHQQQQQSRDPVQEQLQRSRSVANWAQEQARIHEKRIKHKARTQALRELRKQHPIAKLAPSEHSGSSGSLHMSSSSSWSASYSRSSSGKEGPGKRVNQSQKQVRGAEVMESFQEDYPLELSRLDIVIREQEDEDEQDEFGIYTITDDMTSPTVETESLGAGVGRPLFQV
ncbi:hypothetical protein BGZ54_000683 [Gamsiella multidivaricata]|nr:hypothetical protein BGZ54_000683 [Gamsiella multidivaricata]